MTEAKPRILVADDERNIRKNLAMVLESEGYQVDEAADGEEALAPCGQAHPDIAFVDLLMPKITGLEVLARFRTMSSKTAVVIFTAYGSAANAVAAMKLGAVDFFGKTIRSENPHNSGRGDSLPPAFGIGRFLR
jgi:two-component system, NtrC family, response regulator PilR